MKLARYSEALRTLGRVFTRRRAELVLTLTTLGYGDVYPATTLGRVFGGLFAIMGILLIALPTAILGSGFMEVLEEKRTGEEACPRCGRPFLGKGAGERED